MGKRAKLIHEGLHDSLVVNEDGLACLVCLVAFKFSFGGYRGADLGEDGRNVGRNVVEGGAGVADENACELDASPISS